MAIYIVELNSQEQWHYIACLDFDWHAQISVW